MQQMAEQWLAHNSWAQKAVGARPANAAFRVVEACSDYIAVAYRVPPNDPIHFALLDLLTIALKRWEENGIDPFTLYNIASPVPGPADAQPTHAEPAPDPLAERSGRAEQPGVSPGVHPGGSGESDSDEGPLQDDP